LNEATPAKPVRKQEALPPIPRAVEEGGQGDYGEAEAEAGTAEEGDWVCEAMNEPKPIQEAQREAGTRPLSLEEYCTTRQDMLEPWKRVNLPKHIAEMNLEMMGLKKKSLFARIRDWAGV
jgi:hypothetical protein